MTMFADSVVGKESPVPCAHCGLPVPGGVPDLGQEQFCCAGCRAVWETVHSCGLEAYYRLRDSADATFAQAKEVDKKFEGFDTPAFAKLYVTEHQQGGTKVKVVDLFLEGVTCGACVWLVEKLPTVLPGVIEARLALKRGVVRVTWDGSRLSLSRIAQTLAKFGYGVHPAKGISREDVYRRELRSRLVKLGVSGAIAGNLMLLAGALYAGWLGGMEGEYAVMLRVISLVLGVITLAWPGGEFFVSAWRAIKTRQINLDLPICFALGAGGVAGVINVLINRGEIYFDSLGALVFLLLVGRFIQFRQQRRAENAVELLFSMTPSTCRVVGTDGKVGEVPVESLSAGDVVEVRAGELLPGDGVVVDGRGAIDQSLLTGESVLVEVEAGSTVFGGSKNGSTVLRVRVEKAGEDSRVGRLMKMLERGLGEKPEIVKFSDKVGVWFVWGVSLLAVAIFAYWARTDMGAAVDHTVAFLIVTCPCVLGLATPMTLAVAIGALARRDVLVKSGAALEKLAKGGRLMLDKTGTLTQGRMRVMEYGGNLDIRGVIARIEKYSNHPVARALVDAFEGCEPPAALRCKAIEIAEKTDGGISAMVCGEQYRIGSPSFMARNGIVVPQNDLRRRHEALGHTVIDVAIDGEVVGTVALADELRDDAADSVKTLRQLGFAPEIWSGDAQGVVEQVGSMLRLDRSKVHGAVSPENKLAAVRSSPNGVLPIMVGDGVNDAAALAAAGVGIAVHGGSEASLAAADVYIARPGLSGVVDVVTTARKTMRVIRGNFCVSLAYNILAGVLAATGIMNPLIAAILMPVSAATVMAIAVARMTARKRVES